MINNVCAFLKHAFHNSLIKILLEIKLFFEIDLSSLIHTYKKLVGIATCKQLLFFVRWSQTKNLRIF